MQNCVGVIWGISMTAESVKQIVIVPRAGERSPSLAVLCGLAILRRWGGREDYAVVIDADFDDVSILDRTRDYVFKNQGLNSKEIFVGNKPSLFFATMFLTYISDFHELRKLRSFQYNFEQFIQEGRCGDEWRELFKTWEERDPREVLDEIESLLISIVRRAEVTMV